MNSRAMPRVKPPGFENYPLTIFQCLAPGLAEHDFDVKAAFEAKFGADIGPVEIWIDSKSGNDSNNGSLNTPLRTIAEASRRPGVGRIWVKPGVYIERFDLRSSAAPVAGGLRGRPMQVLAYGDPGSVIWRAPGAQPNEMTWLPNGMLYYATPPGREMAMALVFHDGGTAHAVQYFPSVQEANAVASGWTQDSSTGTLFIRHENRDFSQAAESGRLEIMYNRGVSNIVYGATAYLEGIVFRGDSQFQVLEEGVARPSLYARDCRWQWSSYHNFHSEGADIVMQRCISEHSLIGDGWNYYDGSSGPSIVLEVDCVGRFNGVPQTRTFDNQRNKQGSSGHQRSIICRVNGEYYGNFGQGIADTGNGNRTWMVGTRVGDPYSNPLIGQFQALYVQSHSWLDTVRAGGNGSSEGLYVETGDFSSLHNCMISGTVQDIIGLTQPYDPLAP